MIAAVLVAAGAIFLLLSAPARERLAGYLPGSATTVESGPRKSEARRIPSVEPRQVNALGWLEPADGILQVAALTGERLAALDVKKGDVVKKGQILGRLDSRSLRQLEHDALVSERDELGKRYKAEKQVAAARIGAAKVAVERAQSLESESTAKQREIDLLVASRDSTRKDLARLENLSFDLASKQDRERQSLAVKKSEAELAAAEAGKERLEQANRLNLAAAKAELAAAEAGAVQVEASFGSAALDKKLELATAQLARSEIVAPSDGTILEVVMKQGEMIDTRPILQMADLTRMVCVAEVHETEVKRLHVGQKVQIRSAALASPYDDMGLVGEVDEIGRMIGTPMSKSVDPFAATDRHVVRVRCRLDATSTKVASGLVNLQVDVVFTAAKE